MKILNIDTYNCVALLKYNDYTKLKKYLEKKGDFLPEGYEISVHKLAFEDFIEELFYDYNGCGYHDGLIGAYKYIDKYAYKLFISRDEEEEEYNDFTPNRIIDVINCIRKEVQKDNCEESYFIINFLDKIINELTMELKFEIIECDIIDPIFSTQKISKYYKAPLTLSQFELFRVFFNSKVERCINDGRFDWINADNGGKGILLRDSDYNFTEVWVEKENQSYSIYMAGFDCYNKGKYFEKQYNEYSLPDKNILIKLFETLKYSYYCVPEHYDFIPNLIISSINKIE